MSNESKPDLTPAEARAEVEAFMGEGWMVIAPERDGTEEAVRECYVSAWRGDVGLHAFCPTYRAAVSTLKSAWRDAVRPWVAQAADKAFDEGCDYIGSKENVDQLVRIDRTVSRVLKESDHE